MARTGEVSEMRMFGLEQYSFHDWVIYENWTAYRFDITVHYIVAVEIVGPFDDTYKL